MVWLSISALVWAALAFAPSSGAADGGGHRGNTHRGTNNYIIECHNGRDKDVLIHHIKQRDGQVHHDFNSGIFHGVSASVPSLGGDEIKNMAGVKDVWPVQVFSHGAKENSLKPRRTQSGSRIDASCIPCIVGNGNDSEEGLFYSLDPSTSQHVIAVNSFAHRMVASANGSHAVTAGMSSFSASGPTWELDLKPNVGVPGDDIPCPRIDGSYGSCSGTSFAAPQVAGMAALIAERRGDFSPGRLMSLLMTTAAVQKDGHFIPVVQQGGGLAQAWEAAHTTTLIEPPSLAFNDTDHRAQSIAIRVTNKAHFEVTYQLSVLPALTIYARRQKRDFQYPEHIQAPASIDMSKSFLKLGAGQSDTITISAQDPEGLEADRLPVWSGWVAINSSDGKTLTVPYLGLAGSLHQQQVLEPDGASLRRFNHSRHEAEPNRATRFNYTVENGFTTLSASIIIELTLGSRVHVEAVPISLRKWMADRLGKSRGFPIKGYSPRALQRYIGHRSHDKEWDGQIQSGDYLPPGDYELVVRALRIFGDPTMEADWDAAEPLPFQVLSGAGQEACKAYQSGKGPKDALFQNLRECYQVHNKTAVDTPWIPRPQDSSKYDDDNPTEEDCGTYHYCKAHQERPDDVISPFRHRYECIHSHKLLPTIPFDPSSFSECPKTRDPSICGSLGWCVVIFQTGGPAHGWSSSEECLWAHGII